MYVQAYDKMDSKYTNDMQYQEIIIDMDNLFHEIKVPAKEWINKIEDFYEPQVIKNISINESGLLQTFDFPSNIHPIFEWFPPKKGATKTFKGKASEIYPELAEVTENEIEEVLDNE